MNHTIEIFRDPFTTEHGWRACLDGALLPAVWGSRQSACLGAAEEAATRGVVKPDYADGWREREQDFRAAEARDAESER